MDNTTNVASNDFFSILGNYRTGIFIIDTILCLLIPILIQQLMHGCQHPGWIVSTLLSFFYESKNIMIERTIEITQRYNRDGHKVWDYEQKNHLLQKAIAIYLSKSLDFEDQDAKYELLEKTHTRQEEESGSVTSESSYETESCTSNEDEEYYGEVDKLSVEVLPVMNQWVPVESGINFKHEVVTPENPGDRKGVTETKVIFRFQSSLKDGSDRIDAFIEKAYQQYQQMERRKYKEDTSRYFYIQSSSSSFSEGDQNITTYKRYALGEFKTFDNLFFDEKESIMKLLDQFMTKTGKFAIRGFPYKLGFLLHGPPGTGKTSLIKAIAQYTKRHIVTINLGKIRSNQELMDALFDLKFAVKGLDTPIQMSFDQVVFVMEDIDCASSIVNIRRENKDVDNQEKKLNENDEEENENEDVEKKESKTVKSDDEILMSAMIKMVLEDEKKNSKLNLAGLLNVLDGVIDCPGRIIIMTTNHPEKLDPALIRPGRVNKKLLLSYMNWKQVQQMIEYYSMSTLTPEDRIQLETILTHATKQITPAEVEEICAEYDSTNTILHALTQLCQT